MEGGCTTGLSKKQDLMPTAEDAIIDRTKNNRCPAPSPSAWGGKEARQAECLVKKASPPLLWDSEKNKQHAHVLCMDVAG